MRALFADQDRGWIAGGVVMGAVIMITALITFFTVREPKRAAAEAVGQQGFLKSYAAALKNRPFMLALVAYMLHMMGTNIVQAGLIFYYKYIMWDGNNMAAAEGELPLALMFFIGAAFVFIFIWAAISKRIGKKWTYNLGMGLFALAVLAALVVADGMTAATVLEKLAESVDPAFLPRPNWLPAAKSSIASARPPRIRWSFR